MLGLRQLKATLLLALLVIALFSYGANCSSEQPAASAKYLAIIVIDACRPDYFQLTEMPNLRLLMANGVTYAKAWLGQLESNTPPGHATVSTGSLPRNQGVIGFGWRDPVAGNMVQPTTIEAVSQGKLGEMIVASGAVSIPQLVKEADSTAKVLAISSNKFFAAGAMGNQYADYIAYSIRSGKATLVPSGVDGHLPPNQILNDHTLCYSLPIPAIQYDTWVMDATVKMLELERPRVVMINLPETDGVGHGTGGIVAPSAMAEVLANVDRQIGRLIETYRKLGIFDQTLFVVTADHGMIPNSFNVRGELIRKAVEKTGTTALSLGGGTSFDVYLRDQTKCKEAADIIASLNIEGVDAVYYRIREQGAYYYLPASQTASKIGHSLDASYRYLLSTYAGPSSPDVAIALDENTAVGSQPPKKYGSHGGLSWGVQSIPMIFAGPGVKKGYVSDMPARLVDVAPTALFLMGIPTRRMDGIVLADAMVRSSAEQSVSQAELANGLIPLRDALQTKSEQDLAKMTFENRVTIDVDFSRTIGRIRSLQGINAGPLPQRPLEAPLYDQYKRIGVNFVRTHDVRGAFDINVVFPNMQADPFKQSSYNFRLTDLQVEIIRSVGAEVFYRLGYSWGGPSDVPSDYAKFAEICKHIVMHYNQGWANGFKYGIQYWEIWNEPDIKIFWKGTPEQYFKLYDTVARAVKAVDAAVRVGGPALAGRREFLERFLQFCKTNKSPLDFVSWHIYTGGRVPHLVAEAANGIQDLLKRYGFENVGNFLTEWNIYADSTNHDEFWNARGAAWTASALIYLQDTTVLGALRYRGNAGGKEGRGFGLFYDNGEFKKTAFAFLAMNRMLETSVRLACNGSDDAGFATLAGRSDGGNIVRVLISNFDSYYEEFTLALRNLPWQGRSLRCEVYLIDGTNNLTLVDRFEQAQTGSLTISGKVPSSSVCLISLEAIEPVTKQTTTRTGYLGYEMPMIMIALVVGMVSLIALVMVVERSKLTAILRRS